MEDSLSRSRVVSQPFLITSQANSKVTRGKHTKNWWENHHFQWVNQRTKWQCSIAFCMFTRSGTYFVFPLLARQSWTIPPASMANCTPCAWDSDRQTVQVSNARNIGTGSGWWFGTWILYNFMTFHSVGDFIIPTDELHHFSEGQLYQQPGMV